MNSTSDINSTATLSFRKTVYYPVLLLIISMFCISLNHVIGRGVYADIPPVGLGFWRCFIASLILLPFVRSNCTPFIPTVRMHLRKFIFMGVLLTASGTSVLLALHFTTATNVAMINSIQPIITVFLAWVFFNETLKTLQKAGIFLAFTGIIVMITKGDISMLAARNFNLGDFIVLGAMLGLAVYSIKLKDLPGELTSTQLLFVLITIGYLFLLPVYILESYYYQTVPVNSVSLYSIFGMAFFYIVLGILTWNIGVRLLGASVSSIFLNLIPVFGAILSMLFLGERLHFYHLICFLFIFAGMLMVLGQQLRRIRKN